MLQTGAKVSENSTLLSEVEGSLPWLARIHGLMQRLKMEGMPVKVNSRALSYDVGKMEVVSGGKRALQSVANVGDQS